MDPDLDLGLLMSLLGSKMIMDWVNLKIFELGF